MNVAKSMLNVLLALPVAELVVFIVVAAAIGFAWALALVVASSFIGMLVLRHAGGAHIERIRSAVGSGSFTSLQADGTGAITLLAGFLLLVPGFITSVIGLALLVAPLRRLIAWAFGIAPPVQTRRADGVVDLEPEQWHRVPDATLADRREGSARDDEHR